MLTKNVMDFDLRTSPLAGRWLLEASAGTGKTYSLEHIVARLLVEEGASLERILLVTFTNAATNEISERVRQLLLRMLARAEGAADALSDTLEEDMVAQWRSEGRDLEAVFARALASFDDASILTIHKFCQKMLSDFSFTRGGDASATFGSTEQLAQQAVEEFIREKAPGLAPEDAAQLVAWQSDLEKLLEKVVLAAPVVEKMGLEADFEPADGKRRRKAQKVASEALAAVLREFIEKVPARFEALEKNASVMSFNGLLKKTYELVHEDSELAARIRARYDAVLIDEFQDTDSVQYGIFKEIFFPDSGEKGARSVFLVGDPKQAIYGFRNAELETYIAARDEILALGAGSGGVLALRKNFRSAAPLVAFVNEFFNDSPKDENLPSGGPGAFLAGEIAFAPSEAAGSAAQLVRLVDGRLEPVPAVSIWLNPPEQDVSAKVDKSKRFVAEDIIERESDWMARDISQLLDSSRGAVYVRKKAVVDGREVRARRLCPGDIVILIPKRSAAERYIEKLAHRGIRAVLDSKDDVLKTPEACEILAVLRAMLAATDRRVVNAARATRIFGRTLHEIRGDEQAGVRDRALLEEALSRWSLSGPAGAFGLIMKSLGVVERLLKVRQGQRVLQNYTHIIEELQQKFLSLRGALSTLQWLEQEMVSTGEVPENRVVRTLADAQAVRLVTMHSSKGLEYPVVYLAQAGGLKESSKGPRTFFKGEIEGEQACIIAPGGFEGDVKERCQSRERIEKVRLAYVAMTRASSRLVMPLFFTNPTNGHVTGLGHAYLRSLMRWTGKVPSGYEAVCRQVRGRLERVCKSVESIFIDNPQALGIDPGDFARDGQTPVLSEDFAAPGRIIEIRTEPPEGSVIAAAARSGRFEALEAQGLAQSWRRSSFTAIARKLAHPASGAGDEYEPGTDALDAIEAKVERGAALEIAPADAAPQAGAVSLRPEAAASLRGAGVGDWLHRQLQAAFNLGSIRARAERLAAAPGLLAQAYFMTGSSPEELEAAQKLVGARLGALADAVLFRTPEGREVRTSDIKPGRSVPEMEFLLHAPKKSLGVQTLIKSLGAAGLSFESDARDPLSGYVTGSIDLMFEFEGRYWIIDWKSNFLGDGLPASYTQEAMADEIRRKNYALQYAIYLTALKRHLMATTSLTKETVWDAIGGAAYVFLRGIDAAEKLDAQGRRNGVFLTCPREAVDALDALLGRGGKSA